MSNSPARRDEMFKLQESLKLELEKFESLSHASTRDTPSPIYEILHKKIGKPSLRAYFAFKMVQYLSQEGGKIKRGYKKFFERQLPFLLEAIISVQYYHNQILDGKAGVTTAHAINRNLIIGNLFKDQLYRYIEKLEIGKLDLNKVKECVRTIFECVDMGQYIEKHCNTYEALLNGNLSHPFEDTVRGFVDSTCLETAFEITRKYGSVEPQYEAFLRIYLERIYLTNAVLFKLSMGLIVDLMKISINQKEQALKFATYFGLMHQTVNDNTDLLPSNYEQATVAKVCRDAYSDLRNKNITLPLLIHLQRCPMGKVWSYFDKSDTKSEEEYFEEITKALSVYYSMTIAKQLRKVALKYMNSNNTAYIFLVDMCEVAENNRYYKYYYAREKDYKRYKQEKRKLNHDTGKKNDKPGNCVSH